MFEQIKLDYTTNALELWIDQETIETHHGKHYATYTKNFNDLVEKASLTGKLADAINAQFGSLDACKEEVSKLAAAQFGSGWAWLSTDKAGKLYISNSLNQDNPISEGTGYIPLIALDVWEHAYYLKYKNLRPDYIKAFWEVLDWGKVEERYNKIVG